MVVFLGAEPLCGKDPTYPIQENWYLFGNQCRTTHILTHPQAQEGPLPVSQHVHPS